MSLTLPLSMWVWLLSFAAREAGPPPFGTCTCSCIARVCGLGPAVAPPHSFNFRCIAVEEMRRRRYSHLLLANNDIIIPPLAVPILLQQLKTSYDLVVPISSRHGSGFGSESCCVCPSGIVSARSWAVAAAEVPLCAAAIQHRLFGAHSSQLESAYSSVWADSDSGIVPFAAPIS